MNDNVVWKDIQGYEGYYQINNIGEVRSLDRHITHSNGSRFRYKGRMMTPWINSSGYYEIRLSKNGNTKSLKVHRLVAIAFIPNPHGLPEVNHKNEIKTDNYVGNLEWCTSEYNINYGKRSVKAKKSITNSKGVSCVAIRISDGTTREFESIREASRSLDIKREQIRAVLNENKPDKSAKGYIFKIVR